MQDFFPTSRHIQCNWSIGIVFSLWSSLLFGKPHGKRLSYIFVATHKERNRLCSPCWGLLSPTLTALSVLDGLYLIQTTTQRHPSLFFLQHGFENPCWTTQRWRRPARCLKTQERLGRSLPQAYEMFWMVASFSRLPSVYKRLALIFPSPLDCALSTSSCWLHFLSQVNVGRRDIFQLSKCSF